MDDKKYKEYLISQEWNEIRARRMQIDGFRCQGCHSSGNPLNPLEVHHFKYKGVIFEEYKPQNMNRQLVTVCRCCHKIVHNVMNRVTDPETGRRGWNDDSRIPNFHEYGLLYIPICEEDIENFYHTKKES